MRGESVDGSWDQATLGPEPVLVVMAAGASTRFGRPKQLEPVGPHGETLLEYSAFDALRAGCTAVVLVIRPETEQQFRELSERGMAGRMDVVRVHQTIDRSLALSPEAGRRSKPWGTAHAVLAAEPSIGGPFAVANADDFYGAESLATLFRHLDPRSPEEPFAQAPSTHAVVGFEVGCTLSTAGPVSRALCRLDDRGRLVDIVELRQIWSEKDGIRYFDAAGSVRALAGDELVSMNLWGFTPEIFTALRQCFADFLRSPGAAGEAELLLPDVVRSVVRAGEIEVAVLPSRAEWYGLTHSEDLPRVREAVARQVAAGRYPESLWE